MLTDIALRHVYQRGTCSIHLLSKLMKLPPEVGEVIFRRLNDQQYFEVRRMAGDDYIFSLSGSGRRLAAERALTTRYAGPAPVSLKSWTAAVRLGAAQDLIVSREKLRSSFSDIIPPRTNSSTPSARPSSRSGLSSSTGPPGRANPPFQSG